MLGVQQVLSDNSSEDEKQVATVLVAIADISPDTPLDETNTLLKEYPAEAVPEGAVTNRKEIQEQTLRTSAVPNEIIMLAKLQDFKGASVEIPNGMCIVTTSVNLTKTHSGLIRPGDRVDILLSFKVKHPDWGQITKTKTVLEYIEIFNTDSFRRSGYQEDVDNINAKNMSFLVTPEQVNFLMLAESKGNLTLALRHKGNNEQFNTPDIDESALDEFMAGFGKEEEDQDDDPVLVVDSGSTDIRNAIAIELSGSETTPPTDDAQVVEDVEHEIPT